MSPLVSPTTPTSSVTDNDPDNDSDSVFSGATVPSADNEIQKNFKDETDEHITDVCFKGSGLVCSDSSSSELGDRKTTRVVNVDGKRTVFHRAPLQSEV